MKVQTKRFAALFILFLLLSFTFVLQADEEVKDKYPWREELYGRKLATVHVDGIAYYDEARSIIQMVNDLRLSLGLHPLVYNATLEAAAMQRAAETSVLWSHMRPDGTFIFYTPPYSGENIAAGNTTAEKTFQQWVDSPGHYRAMTNPNFTAIGIGAFGNALGDPPLWWAQIFSTSLGATEYLDVQSPAIYQPEVSLAPDILELRLNASERQSLAWGQNGDVKFMVRILPGRELQLLPYVHYNVEDEFRVMTLLKADEWSYEVSDASVLSLTEDGRIFGRTLGEAEIQVTLKAYPELKDTYLFKVLAGESYLLNSTLRPDLANEAETAMLKRSLQEPKATWDSTLERYALEICKHASLCESSTPAETYPNIKAADMILNMSANYSWVYFSTKDPVEEQGVQLPDWAESYAVVVLDSGEDVYTTAVFSTEPADGQRLYSEKAALRYVVQAFEDRTNYALKLKVDQVTDETLPLLRERANELELFAKAPSAPKISEDPLPSVVRAGAVRQSFPDETPLALCAMITAGDSSIQPLTPLDPECVRFTSQNPEVLQVTEDGYLKPIKNGTATVKLEVLDAKNENTQLGEVLQSEDFVVKVDLAALRPKETVEKVTTKEESTSRNAELEHAKKDLKQAIWLVVGILLTLLFILLVVLIIRRYRGSTADQEE